LPEWSRPVPLVVPPIDSDPRCLPQCQERDLPAPVPQIRACAVSLLRNLADAVRHPAASARPSQMNSISHSAACVLSPRLTYFSLSHLVSSLPLVSKEFQAWCANASHSDHR